MLTRIVVESSDNSSSFARDDRIFLGEGLFETLRVSSAAPCFADLHWQRIHDSARALGIPFEVSIEEWHRLLQEQIKKDNVYHGGIKALLSGGSAPRGLAQQSQVSHLMLQTFNYAVSQHPVRLISVPWLRDAANPIYRFKTVNYLEAINARRLALNVGADDALFFNMQHHVTETTCANLFLVIDDQLFTPSLVDGVLPGITRSRILSFCAQERLSYKELSITKELLLSADAVFISNSLQGIRKVEVFEDHYFACDHPLVERLIAWV